MLAALRYILHAFTYTKNWPENNKTIHMYCNNLAIIQRIGWHKKRIVTTPKDVYRANYDFEAAIKNTIDTLRIRKIFIKEKHVRDHQDNQADYYTLSHEEQLNVEADHEATDALKKNTHTRANTSLCLPQGPCSITTKDQSPVKKPKHSVRLMVRLPTQNILQ